MYQSSWLKYKRNKMVVYIKYSRENKTIELMERFRSPGSMSQQSPAVYAHCVMTGSLPPPFIGTFVRCPLFCYRPCVGSITAPYAALPIQLVTYLWHATFCSRRVILVVYHPLMFCRCMLSCTCMSPHVNTRTPGGSSSVLVMLLLISGHLIPPRGSCWSSCQHPV